MNVIYLYFLNTADQSCSGARNIPSHGSVLAGVNCKRVDGSARVVLPVVGTTSEHSGLFMRLFAPRNPPFRTGNGATCQWRRADVS